ncbi:MAG: plasmid pRiA4b ORF-3 family protein [Spirochaetaceae bacterium]|jgi:uncharacterized protein YjaG (DUF416 family)|nr:plasmid pRiA4b ORF-3 family protein [Spirochaetaceae bacterium]
MTAKQEDAVFEFLDNRTESFSIKDIIRHVRGKDTKKATQLVTQIQSLLDNRHIAFRLDSNTWISRRGVFEGGRFSIRPTRLELLNGILIPGHRCIPFANPVVPFKEYKFIWQGKLLEMETSEGEPDEFYPYFALFGEEYAPQYLVRDNPENEALYDADPYEDPPEVSLNTLDMRNVYRESGFTPGDRFAVTVRNWLTCEFELERVPKDAWSAKELDAWQEWAEKSFYDAFELGGPCASTEEQIALAYFLGGKRMRDVPALPAEELLLELTCKIELTPFGMESRFWYTGKEIPDFPELSGINTQCDQTPVELMLFENGIPVSEFVLQAYVQNAVHKKEFDVIKILEWIAPPPVRLRRHNFEYLAQYLLECFEDFVNSYSPFIDKNIAPVRLKACELHTAVIELAHSLQKGNVDKTWLPSHVFIQLSQIQIHTACILEELNVGENIKQGELNSIEISLDNMTEAFEELSESIKRAIRNFRHSNISLVKAKGESEDAALWRTIQISIGGTEIWRRIVLPAETGLKKLQKLIITLFGWSGTLKRYFTAPLPKAQAALDMDKHIRMNETLESLLREGINEFTFEYNNYWTVKIINLSAYDVKESETPHCDAGAGLPPNELLEGPLRFRRLLATLETGTFQERKEAEEILGADFHKSTFSLDKCNAQLRSIYAGETDK